MNKAIGYVRVSTEDQAERGVSLSDQRARIAAYCQLYDLDLVGIYADEGVSAKDIAHRPQLQAALSALEANPGLTLVIMKLDRLTRSLSDWDLLVRQYFGEGAKTPAVLRSVNDSIDTSSAGGRLVLNVLMTVYQWEREVIGERTKSALRHLKETRKAYSGVPPYGWDDVDGELHDNVFEQSWTSRMCASRSNGRGWKAIAKDMNEQQVPTKKPGGKWHANTVRRIVERAQKEGR